MKKRVLSRHFLPPAIQIGLEVLNAHRMAQKLAAGLVLDPGEEQQLATMLPRVRSAVEACFKPHSRYLPPLIRKRRAVGPRTKSVDPVDYWQPIDRNLASALLSGDASTERRRRRKVVHLPLRVPGFGKVVSAFAQSYSVSTSKIRENMARARTLEAKSRNDQQGGDQIVDPIKRPNKASKRQS